MTRTSNDNDKNTTSKDNKHFKVRQYGVFEPTYKQKHKLLDSMTAQNTQIDETVNQ